MYDVRLRKTIDQPKYLLNRKSGVKNWSTLILKFNFLIFKVSNINNFVRLRADPNILGFSKSMWWSECFINDRLTTFDRCRFWTTFDRCSRAWLSLILKNFLSLQVTWSVRVLILTLSILSNSFHAFLSFHALELWVCKFKQK